MNRRGLGFLVLLIVVGVVLWLSARAWREMHAPAVQAIRMLNDDAAVGLEDDDGKRSDLPTLGAAQGATDAHANAVQEALAATD